MENMRELLHGLDCRLFALLNRLGSEERLQELFGCNFVTNSNGSVITVAPMQFPVFRTITVDTSLKNVSSVLAALEEAGFETNELLEMMFSYKPFEDSFQNKQEESVALTVVSNQDLGLEHGTIYETCAVALATGQLEMCEPQDAWHLRLQYPDQPPDEQLILGRNRIHFAQDLGEDRPLDHRWISYEGVFVIEMQGEKPCFKVWNTSSATIRFGGQKFVFRLRQKR